MNELAPISSIQKLDSPRLILTSHSVDNVFDYCPRKFEFLAVHLKEQKRDSGFAADVGTALHEGLGAWLIARSDGASEADSINIGYLTLLKFYPWETELEQIKKDRTNHRVIEMFDKIVSSGEWDNWDLLKVDNGKWAVEVPFLIKHTSLGEFIINSTNELAILCTQGKIDFIMQHRISKAIRTWDLKTTVMSLDLIRSEYTYSGQQVGYSHVAHAMLGATPVDFSVWYMIARFTSTGQPFIHPIEMFKGQDLIDDYWLTKIDRLRRMKHYAETGWFPRTNGGCNAWQRECMFFDICRSRDDDLIRRWFEVSLETEVVQGYDWWVTLEV